MSRNKRKVEWPESHTGGRGREVDMVSRVDEGSIWNTYF